MARFGSWLLERLRSDRVVAVLLILPSIIAIGIFATEFNDIIFSFVTGRNAATAMSALQRACTGN